MLNIKGVDKLKNEWQILSRSNPNYPSRNVVYLVLNGHEFKLYHFTRKMDFENFADLVRNLHKGAKEDAKDCD